jgi:hypothetical protein
MDEEYMNWNNLSQQTGAVGGIESALTTLQPIRDLAKNWDIDIATWYVYAAFLYLYIIPVLDCWYCFALSLAELVSILLMYTFERSNMSFLK